MIRFERWKLMSTAIDLMGLARSADAALEILREHARAIAQADGVTIVRRIGDEVAYVGEDAISPLWTGQRFPIQHCISGLAMIERRPIFIPDIREDPRVPLNAYLSTFVASMAMFPIGHGAPSAALGVYWATAQSIDPDTLALLDALTRSANGSFERLAVAGEIAAGRQLRAG
ncbi:MAG TPA: GAF domain-containing protein [Sphingomonas sp.]|nr:GAF domain-containing protein [Sphingomonas sp.]